jgi:hypothetical protein
MHDVNIVDILSMNKEAILVRIDRGYSDFTRYYAMNPLLVVLAIRAKINLFYFQELFVSQGDILYGQGVITAEKEVLAVQMSLFINFAFRRPVGFRFR